MGNFLLLLWCTKIPATHACDYFPLVCSYSHPPKSEKNQSDNVNTSHPTLSRQCVPLCYWKWRWKVLAWLRISLILAACWSAKSVLMAHSINWIRFNAVPDSSQRLAVKNGLLISVIHGAGDITASSKRLIFSEKPPLLICHRNTLPDFFKGTFLWMKI